MTMAASHFENKEDIFIKSWVVWNCMLAMKRLCDVTTQQPTNDGHLGELVDKWIACEPIHSYFFVLIHSYTNTDHLNYLDAEPNWLLINYGMPHKHKKKVAEIEPELRCRLLKLVIGLRSKVFGELLSKDRSKHPYNVFGNSLLYMLA